MSDSLPTQNAVPPGQDVHDDEISLGELFNVIAQRLWLVGAIFAAALAAGVAYALLATPIYKADALIQVEEQTGGALSGLAVFSDPMAAMQGSKVAGELEILRSREVLLKAINQTKADIAIEVDNRFPLLGNLLARRHDANTPNQLAEPVLGLDSFAWGGERLEVSELQLPRRWWGQPFYLSVTDAGFALYDNNDNLLLEGPAGRRYTFNVAGEPAVIAVTQLAGRPGTRFEVKKIAPTEAVEQLRKELNVSEAGKQSDIINISFEHRDVVFATDMVNAIANAYLAQNVERRSAEARSSLKFLEAQLPNVKRSVDEAENALTGYRERSGTVAVDKEAEGLLQQAIALENSRLEATLKRDEMLQRFKPEHPDVKAANQQIAAIGKAINELNKQINQLPEAQRGLFTYERDARVNTALYISLLNNAQELRVAEAGTIGNVRIIDYALRNDRPVAPRKALVVAVAGAAGLMLGILAAFVAYFLRPAVQRPEQIEQATGLTTYVSIPLSETGRRSIFKARQTNTGANPLLAVSHPEDPAIESLRSLRTGLTFALMGAPGKVITFTGATASVGKTFVSANFGALLATGGQRVLVMGTDLRRPRLHLYFGLDKKQAGLSDVLAGNVSLEQVQYSTGVPGLTVLPAGTVPPNPGELLLSNQFTRVLDNLAQKYDLIVIDTPPILPVADALAVLKHTTVAFMVARAEQSTVSEQRDAMAKLRHSGVAAPIKGVIYNGVQRNRVGYGSSYKYYYSYK
ncbi:polysaccharide biosynthesis tyrosine autokinase [Pusillimonas minor]|uniref:Putative tyrosine-protein kinase EpsB n=1 Tax=Pusillimonas minor TaxID=2697024 RepID=A0A842HNF6_9BURK|nr:polysaccharide biosynthesis tyrosine autokinase [Pusillimonas minor]MBC2769837.1 polysaccharide biosynthesis tyrosine autokinase [Pusillimonas minor]